MRLRLTLKIDNCIHLGTYHVYLEDSCVREFEIVQIVRVSETNALEIPIIGLGTSYRPQRSCPTKHEGDKNAVRQKICVLHKHCIFHAWVADVGTSQ